MSAKQTMTTARQRLLEAARAGRRLARAVFGRGRGPRAADDRNFSLLRHSRQSYSGPMRKDQRDEAGPVESLGLFASTHWSVVLRARDKSEGALSSLFQSYRQPLLTAQLQHPNIVPVFEVGDADGPPYFTMEYAPGTDLARLTRDRPLRPQDAARYIEHQT